MVTPYDWQEGIGHRAEYVEARLRHGSPVVAVSRPEGIVAVSYRRQTRKLFEVYDRLLFAAIGQQSDIESIRVAALEFAHQEGFNRSERDVTIQRVVNALSGPIKRAFGDFGSTPVVARSLFAEVGATAADDKFVTLEFDGDYAFHVGSAWVGGVAVAPEGLGPHLEAAIAAADPLAAVGHLKEAWRVLMDSEQDDPVAGLELDAVLLERDDTRVNRFRTLT